MTNERLQLAFQSNALHTEYVMGTQESASKASGAFALKHVGRACPVECRRVPQAGIVVILRDEKGNYHPT